MFGESQDVLWRNCPAFEESIKTRGSRLCEESVQNLCEERIQTVLSECPGCMDSVQTV